MNTERAEAVLSLEVYIEGGVSTVLFANGVMQIKVNIRGQSTRSLTEAEQDSITLALYTDPEDPHLPYGWSMSETENEFSHSLPGFGIQHPVVPMQVLQTDREASVFNKTFWVSTTKAESVRLIAAMKFDGLPYTSQQVDPYVGEYAVTLCGVPPVNYGKHNTSLEMVNVGRFPTDGVSYLDFDQDNYYLSLDTGYPVKKVSVNIPSPASGTTYYNNKPYTAENYLNNGANFHICDNIVQSITYGGSFNGQSFSYTAAVNQKYGEVTLARILLVVDDGGEFNWKITISYPQPFELWDLYGNYGCFIADHDYNLNLYASDPLDNSNNFVEYHHYRA